MRGLFLSLSAVICVVTLSGCATMTRGTQEAYTVTTDPPGATVFFSSGETCTTPCTVQKKHRDNFIVNIEKDGYETVSVEVTHKSSSSGNVARAGSFVMIGGLLWAGIDTITGATRELTPNPCEVKLVPQGPTQMVMNKADKTAAVTPEEVQLF